MDAEATNRAGSDRSQSQIVFLSFYGIGIAITGDWPEVLEAIRLDFAWFEVPSASRTADVEIAVERRAPDFDRLGGAKATFVTPRNVVYQTPGRTIVEYFGRAVTVLDRESGHVLAQGDDRAIVHEAVYQFILSRVGEHLDRRKLPRLHGVGLVGAQGAVTIMLPSGGGKTTLALRALSADGVKLLSDDSPLIDRRGWLHPFPLRLGINPTDAAALPEGHVRQIERMEFHPKLALELHAFADGIASGPAPLRHLVIGQRSLGTKAQLEPLPRRAAVTTLVREAVVGVGIYQGMEFVLQRGMRDVLGKTGIAVTRATCCASGLARARVWSLTLGRDLESNWAAIQPLLK